MFARAKRFLQTKITTAKSSVVTKLITVYEVLMSKVTPTIVMFYKILQSGGQNVFTVNRLLTRYGLEKTPYKNTVITISISTAVLLNLLTRAPATFDLFQRFKKDSAFHKHKIPADVETSEKEKLSLYRRLGYIGTGTLASLTFISLASAIMVALNADQNAFKLVKQILKTYFNIDIPDTTFKDPTMDELITFSETLCNLTFWIEINSMIAAVSNLATNLAFNQRLAWEGNKAFAKKIADRSLTFDRYSVATTGIIVVSSVITPFQSFFGTENSLRLLSAQLTGSPRNDKEPSSSTITKLSAFSAFTGCVSGVSSNFQSVLVVISPKEEETHKWKNTLKWESTYRKTLFGVGVLDAVQTIIGNFVGFEDICKKKFKIDTSTPLFIVVGTTLATTYGCVYFYSFFVPGGVLSLHFF
jgi:hypothetical protein